MKMRVLLTEVVYDAQQWNSSELKAQTKLVSSRAQYSLSKQRECVGMNVKNTFKSGLQIK